MTVDAELEEDAALAARRPQMHSYPEYRFNDPLDAALEEFSSASIARSMPRPLPITFTSLGPPDLSGQRYTTREVSDLNGNKGRDFRARLLSAVTSACTARVCRITNKNMEDASEIERHFQVEQITLAIANLGRAFQKEVKFYNSCFCDCENIPLLGHFEVVEGTVARARNWLLTLSTLPIRNQWANWGDPKGFRENMASAMTGLVNIEDVARSSRESFWGHTCNHLKRRSNRSIRSQQTRPPAESSIKGCLNGDEVSAFPDTGAAANFVTLEYAERHGMTIDPTARSSVKLGNGSTITTLGTITSLFSFAGEDTIHKLSFNVLRTSLYDVVLGSPFLEATKTLTRWTNRIQRHFRDARSPSFRLCALGSQQRVRGAANGVEVDAMPDTGADVSLMSASFATSHGFEVDCDPQHRVLLQFANGSTAKASGLVRDVEWQYAGSDTVHGIDVYVLSELCVDLLLGDDFLYETDAFVAHEADFWNDDGIEHGTRVDGDDDVAWLFWIIKLVNKVVKHRRKSGMSDTDALYHNNPEETWQAKKCKELNAYLVAKQASEILPESERSKFLEPHVARWEKFLETRPDTPPVTVVSSAASSSSSSGGSAALPPAAAAAVQNTASNAPPSQALKSSKHRLRWFGHGFRPSD